MALGKEVRGLYCLNPTLDNKIAINYAEQYSKEMKQLTSKFVACLSTSEIWNFHLGHTSFEPVRYIDLPNCHKMIRHSACQISIVANMHRLSFQVTSSRTSCFLNYSALTYGVLIQLAPIMLSLIHI